jgi:serine phosphatase RsbU (regulator of sigma subunit)
LHAEISNLRRKAAINAQIGEFVSEIYDLQDEKEVFDSLTQRLYELTTFEKMAFLSFVPDTANLIVSFSKGFKHDKGLSFSFDVFENSDENIISAIFYKKSVVIKNGFSEINDLSLRLDMDSYSIIPIVIYSGEKTDEKESVEIEEDDISFRREKDMLKTICFAVSGIFVFDCGDMDDLEAAENISLSEKIIHLAGKTINNILVLKKFRQETERNKKELEQARIVQEKLLPEKLPCNDFLQSFAFYIPVDEVGGDYYDLFVLKEGIYAVFIADVSGHGVSAALVMSATKILLKTYASADLTPSQTLRKINEVLVNHFPTNHFVTAFYAVIDTNKRNITYTCAGHCPILLFNKETKEYMQFQSDGFFVGMFPELDLPDHEYKYSKGKNRLLLYTDGVVDSSNKEKMQYGLIRLKTIVNKTLEKSAKETVDEVMNNLCKFIGKTDIADDMTLFIVDF